MVETPGPDESQRRLRARRDRLRARAISPGVEPHNINPWASAHDCWRHGAPGRRQGRRVLSGGLGRGRGELGCQFAGLGQRAFRAASGSTVRTVGWKRIAETSSTPMNRSQSLRNSAWRSVSNWIGAPGE
jgi:hypothetical protein